MNVKQHFIDLLKILLCGEALFCTFFTVIDLTYFLSIPDYKQLQNIATHIDQNDFSNLTWRLTLNSALLSLFMLQHSLMSASKIKDLFKYYGFQVIYRSLYIISTSVVLSQLTKNWQLCPHVILWQVNLNYRPYYWLFISSHTLAWLLIYIGNICVDVTELLGIKQVYYSICNLPEPSERKSCQLNRLNCHMRHPSFIGFVFIFWWFPIMTLDRLLLATITTLYMYLAWNTDDSDYAYQKYQFQRKHHELQQINRLPYNGNAY